MTYFKYLFKSFNYFAYYIYQKIVIFANVCFALLLLQQNLHTFYFYNNLAFNISFLYNSKNITFSHKIKKIYLLNTNNQLCKLNNLLFSQSFLEKTTKNYLNRLKFSGFIYSINYNKLFINCNKYCFINIRYNYFVKTIKIKNFNNLIIPNYTLKQLFNNHIGLPKNYRLIYKSIKNLLFWYHIQGFVWAKVILINDEEVNSINIIINEGKIIDNIIICKNCHQFRENQLISKNIESILSLNKGNILNKKQLEKQLKIIKQIYNIEEIKYTVKLYREGLLITVNYSIKNNCFTTINYFPCLSYNKLKLLINNFFIQINNKKCWFYYKCVCTYLLQFRLNYYSNIHIKLDCYSYTFYLYRYIKTFIYSSLNYLYFYSNIKINYMNQWQININDNHFLQNINVFSISNIKLVNISQINKILHLKQKIENYLYQCNQCFLNIYYLQHLKLKSANKYFTKTISIFSLYIISTHYQASNLLLAGIYTIKLKINYCLLKESNFYYTVSNISIINKFKQQIYITYLYYYIKYNISNLLINKIILFQTFLINSEDFIFKNDNSIITFKLKYNILFNKYQSFYIFNNYLFNFNMTLNSKFYNNKYNQLIGCGLQLNLPFKQITYIRLEYILNI